MGYCFGECELDPRRRELRRGCERVHLQPRVFDLLLHLIEHADRVVHKGELLDEIWRGVAVSDAALVSAVRDARLAVGDDGRRQEIIRTIPRVGFRFVAPVTNASGSSSPTNPSTPLQRWRCETLIELAEQRTTSGEYHRGARDLFRQAAQMAREGGWPDLLGRSALGLGEVSHGIALGDRELVALLEEAIRALGDPDEGSALLRSRLRARLAIELGPTGQIERARALGRAALPAARRAGDDRGLAEARLARLMVLSGPQHLAERREAAWELVVTAGEETGEMAVWGHHLALQGELEAGDRERLDALVASASGLRHGLHHAELLGFFEAGRAGWEGRFEAARRLVGHMVTCDESAPLVGFAANTWILRGWLAWLTGQSLPARWSERLRERCPAEYAHAGLAFEAFVASRVGDVEGAREAYEECVDLPVREDMFQLFALTALAEVAASLGDGERGERLGGQLRPYADRVAVGMATHYVGSVHRPLGNLARLAGRSDEAIAHLSSALKVELHMRARPFAAIARRDLGVALLDAGRPVAARHELLACVGEAEAMGMPGLVRDARELLDSGRWKAVAAPLAGTSRRPATG